MGLTVSCLLYKTQCSINVAVKKISIVFTRGLVCGFRLLFHEISRIPFLCSSNSVFYLMWFSCGWPQENKFPACFIWRDALHRIYAKSARVFGRRESRECNIQNNWTRENCFHNYGVLMMNKPSTHDLCREMDHLSMFTDISQKMGSSRKPIVLLFCIYLMHYAVLYAAANLCL